ncbi:hypothetical protein PMF13cell1_01801 [Blautia producta]|uniref:Cas10/Cmr2 second palm domain-containing protein n=1 Tax=Blautia producta TaxID=33035 RepID=A0A4P6LZ63_9FIRM|nr:hypothetical protein [Blautia producta]QBE96257.1 hypothetical protein PMF13cell1_01801 [Blautia producta]
MRYLMILEVSQKQAYIFASTKLKDNIENSEAIVQVTDSRYLEDVAARAGIHFSMEDNLVYSGGGHTVLEFPSEKIAKEFAFEISKTVRREFPEMELFIKTIQYSETEDPGQNLKRLSEALEVKKSVRAAAFHQGTFGVERMDATLRKAIPTVEAVDRIKWNPQSEDVPEGYSIPTQFDDLGNSKNESSFIAVVHIDGNAMGKRVEKIRRENQTKPWAEYKSNMRKFSESVDKNFKEAYKEMLHRVAQNLKNGNLSALELQGKMFPVRKIILAGDDVCFVTEGRIGLEAARIFIEQLKCKKNDYDQKGYTACAGVAIVHKKYPFYKAYELSEILCSNAKKYIASFSDEQKDASASACAIDWHIEFGVMLDSLAEMRKQYQTADGKQLELRPYLLWAEKDIWDKEKIRRYGNFRTLIKSLQSHDIAYARGKIKEFCAALKEGEQAAWYYMKNNLMDELALEGFVGIYEEVKSNRLFTGKGLDRKIFAQTADGIDRALFFDAIEILDTYINLD